MCVSVRERERERGRQRERERDRQRERERERERERVRVCVCVSVPMFCVRVVCLCARDRLEDFARAWHLDVRLRECDVFSFAFLSDCWSTRGIQCEPPLKVYRTSFRFHSVLHRQSFVHFIMQVCVCCRSPLRSHISTPAKSSTEISSRRTCWLVPSTHSLRTTWYHVTQCEMGLELIGALSPGVERGLVGGGGGHGGGGRDRKVVGSGLGLKKKWTRRGGYKMNNHLRTDERPFSRRGVGWKEGQHDCVKCFGR